MTDPAEPVCKDCGDDIAEGCTLCEACEYDRRMKENTDED